MRLLGKSVVKLLVMLIFFFLGQHEAAELLEMTFKIGCVLLFLKIREVGMLHRRY